DRVLTSLGTGQALITVLNDKGIPTEVVATHLIPPRAVMGPVNAQIYNELVQSSPFYAKYHQTVERQSASEILDEKIQAHTAEVAKVENEKQKAKANGRRSTRQTPLEAAQKAATTTLAREGTKLLAKLANGLLTAMFRRKR